MKGGLSVDINGIRAFMPASQSDAGYHSNLDDLVGTGIEIKIMNFSKNQANVVVSRRMAMEEDKKKLKDTMIHKVKEGARFKGTV